MATVIEERDRKHRWVPWVMYGLAGAISFSRAPRFAHFPSELFLGAALGGTRSRGLMFCEIAHTSRKGDV